MSHKQLYGIIKQMSRKKKWTEKAILEDAKKYKTREEWKLHSMAGYRAANKYSLIKTATAHMRTINRWDKEKILKEAKKYKTRKEWKTKSSYSYGLAYKFGIFTKACSHMQAPNDKWTDAMVIEDAKKYKTREEWKANSKAYQIAANRKLFSMACAHMPYIIKRYSNEDILEDAKKYKTRGEWATQSPSIYSSAHKRKMLEHACAHMKLPSIVSQPERNILELVKQYYPKAQTFRDAKVTISNKPHIKGFHIDIYIPELRKGIEFNGKYWHSIEGLRRGRPDWPSEDLENYHLLKTEHFNKKGIEILYIDEKEWLENQDKCIENIKEFLNIK